MIGKVPKAVSFSTIMIYSSLTFDIKVSKCRRSYCAASVYCCNVLSPLPGLPWLAEVGLSLRPLSAVRETLVIGQSVW